MKSNEQTGRMSEDAFHKIYAQKVCALDLNLSVLERYLEESTSTDSNITKEIGDKDLLSRTRLN
ncbi:hypothetical protein L484_007064 [Morus notabilis]|uniref:Uncharacterized protein n=1 Tax=Morus notabilis TaxID=981085 RepID=W9RKP7_9ROSA|nr:hypothetical protein L484_007064 [Morus notabilis]